MAVKKDKMFEDSSHFVSGSKELCVQVSKALLCMHRDIPEVCFQLQPIALYHILSWRLDVAGKVWMQGNVKGTPNEHPTCLGQFMGFYIPCGRKKEILNLKSFCKSSF